MLVLREGRPHDVPISGFSQMRPLEPHSEQYIGKGSLGALESQRASEPERERERERENSILINPISALYNNACS